MLDFYGCGFLQDENNFPEQSRQENSQLPRNVLTFLSAGSISNKMQGVLLQNSNELKMKARNSFT